MSHAPTWVTLAQATARFTLVLLFGLSVWSFTIMIDRFRFFTTLRKKNDLEKGKALLRAGDRKALEGWLDAQSGPAPQALKVAILAETRLGGVEAVDRAVKSFLNESKPALEKGLTVLATLGANAPFIGLFGTVLGIIQAFAVLGANQSAIDGVMSGISESLVATAVGLFVAIPAVVAYNVFSRQVRSTLSDCEVLRDLYLSTLAAPTRKGSG